MALSRLARILIFSIVMLMGMSASYAADVDTLLRLAEPAPFPDTRWGGTAPGPGALVPMFPWEYRGFSGTEAEALPSYGEETPSPVAAGGGEPSQVEDTTVYPFSSVVLLVMEYDGFYSQCSGAFVLDDHLILTAGHCIYQHETGGYPKRIWVIPGQDGAGQPFGSIAADNWATNEAWIDYEDYYHDWAVVEVEPFAKETGWLGAVVENDDSWYLGRTFFTAGYPADQGYTGDVMWTDAAKGVSSDAYMIRVAYHYSDHPYDCIPGQSGSAIWEEDDDGDRRIAAVLTLSDCSGVKVSSEVLDTIESRSCEGCFDGGACFTEGDLSPSDPCVVCGVEANASSWVRSDADECRRDLDPLGDETDSDSDNDSDEETGACGC